MFDWQKEFSEIMQAGGFDAVIGNPPYIRIQIMQEWAPESVEYLKTEHIGQRNQAITIFMLSLSSGA